MRAKTGGLVFLGLALALLILAAGPQTSAGEEHFDVNLTVPSTVTPPNPFAVTIRVTKRPPYPPDTFQRIAVAYAPNDNLTYVGPYEVWQGTPTWSGSPPSTTVTVNLQLLTARPSGSIIPLVVTLWDAGYNQNDFRGGGACGIKISR